jgi:hypothetical protein
MLRERLACLQEAGQVLHETHSGRFANCVTASQQSAAALVQIVVRDFACFRDSHDFLDRRVHFHKRAQILVADTWACFNGAAYGIFHDIDDAITMFADYRIPQMLHSLGCLRYSPALEARLRRLKEIPSGDRCEIELRGSSIWAVELLKRQMVKGQSKDAAGENGKVKVNSILIDFLLYDTLKERERAGDIKTMIPHHRTRSIWY